jgi:hypothetical protein
MSDWSDGVASALTSNTNPGFDWNEAIKRLIGAGTGLFVMNQGKRAAQAGVNIAQDSANQRRAAYNQYAAQLAGLAPSVSAAYAPRSGTVRTALATGTSDPTTGQVTNTLDPRAQGLFDKYLGGAQAAINQAGDFDPRALAQERLAAQQALLAPLRQAEDNKMMRTLAAKGLLGVGTHDTGLPETGGPANPYMAALAGARAQADATMAANALQSGEDYLDRLLRRSSGLFGNAKTISDVGMNTGAAAAQFGNQLSQDSRAANNAVTNLYNRAFQAQLEGAMPSADFDRARTEQARADAVRRSSVAQGASGMFGSALGSVLGGVLSSPNVGNMFSRAGDWFSGLFNTTNRTGPMDSFYVPSSGWTSGYDLI